MLIDVKSTSDCQALVTRIQQTLSTNGYNMSKIPVTPKPFPLNDNEVLEQLSEAILSRQAVFASIRGIFPSLKGDLFNYDVSKVAALTDSDIQALFSKYQSQVKARFLKDELLAIRDNAIVFRQITFSTGGSVCNFIKSYLNIKAYNPCCKCYIRPNDDALIRLFTNSSSKFKLRLVRLGTCCEFFKNIGIDEFKPDVHTIRFLNRINIDRTKAKVSRNPIDVREIGITIAQTLLKPRAFVDGLIWCLCADYEGEICTENDPKCYLCKLKNEPALCPGFPNRMQIRSNPLGAAKRFKECNLTRKEAAKKMVNAGLPQRYTDEILTKVYGPERTPKVKWEDIETFIKANPCGSAEVMKQSGSSYAETSKYMKKAGLEPDEIDRILSKVYSNSEQ